MEAGQIEREGERENLGSVEGKKKKRRAKKKTSERQEVSGTHRGCGREKMREI